MKKKVFLIPLALFMAAGVTSCKSASPEPSPTPVDVVKVTSIEFGLAKSTIKEGETTTITGLRVLPDNAANKEVAWSSSNSAVASINDNGVVSGVKAGSAKIIATAKDGSGIKKEVNIVVEVKEHVCDPDALTHVNEVPATCTEDGVAEHYICEECNKLYDAEKAPCEAADLVLPKTGHGELTNIPSDPATCTEPGVEEYYQCPDCLEYFEDEDAEVLIPDLEEWKGAGGNGYIEPKGHNENLTYFAATPKSCSAAGNEEYYQCPDCLEYFEDEDAEVLIPDLEEWKGAGGGGYVPASHGELTKTEKVDAQCEVAGCQAYWQCPDCKKYYLDENAENEIADLATWKAVGGGGYIAPKGHSASMIHNEKVKETCTADGTKEYYQCPDCKKYFEDAAATKEIADINTWKVIPAHAHDYGTIIPQTDKTRTTDGMKAHYVCSECSGLFDESYNKVTADDLTIKAQTIIPASGEEMEIPFKAEMTETVIVDVKLDEKYGKVNFCLRQQEGTWARLPYINVSYDGTINLGGDDVGVKTLNGISYLGITDDGYVRLSLDLDQMDQEGTVNKITHVVVPKWGRNAGAIDLNPVGHDCVAVGKKFIHGTQTSVNIDSVTTGNLVFDITFLTDEADAQCRLNLYKDWSASKDFYLKLKDPYANVPAWGKLMEIPGGAGVLGNRFRYTVDVAKFIEANPSVSYVNMFAIESATNYDVVVNVNPTEPATGYQSLYAGKQIKFAEDVNVFNSPVLSFEYSIPNDLDSSSPTQILIESREDGYIGTFQLTPTGLAQSYDGLSYEDLGDGFVEVTINFLEVTRTNASSKKLINTGIENVFNISSHSNWGDKSTVLIRNISAPKVNNYKACKAGTTIVFDDPIAASDMTGKSLSFDFMMVGTDLAHTDYVALSLTTLNEVSNVSGEIDIAGDLAPYWKNETITSLGNNWYNLTVDVSKFDGNGADKTKVEEIYVKSVSANIKRFVIDVDSIEFVDFTRNIYGDVLFTKLVNPIENWKTSGKKIEFDYVHIPNKTGYQKDVFNINDASGSTVAQFTVRTTDHTFYIGNQSGSPISGAVVDLGTGYWRVTVDLSILNPYGTCTGAESISEIRTNAGNWSMDITVNHFAII